MSCVICVHWGVGGLWVWVNDGSGGGTGYVGVLSDEDLEEDERSICLGDYSSLRTSFLHFNPSIPLNDIYIKSNQLSLTHTHPPSIEPHITQYGLHHQSINGLPEASLPRQWCPPSRKSRPMPNQSYISRLADNYITWQSDAARFSKITDMKRSPTNDNAAARRASWEEQTIPRGAGILGDMWNK